MSIIKNNYCFERNLLTWIHAKCMMKSLIISLTAVRIAVIGILTNSLMTLTTNPDINSIDDIPEDEFTGMLIKHGTTVE